MLSFKPKSWWLVILAAGSLGIANADRLILTGDARLTGTVRSISEAGVVELDSILAPDAILLKAEAVAKVEFSTPEASSAPPGTLIELVNGDLLPANLDSLDDQNLTIATSYAGRLTIPREALKSMQLGVRKRPAIYSGPKSAEEWSRDVDESKQWKFSGGSLISNGQATASRDFKTPHHFILKFTLKWQANPNFQIFFADPLTPGVELVDRYYLQFNSAGLEIKRESSTGKRFQTVILLSRTPDQFPNNQVDVEIRVDRKTSRLHLLLNGEPEGAGIDPVSAPPLGGGLTLVNGAPAALSQEIRGIEIAELDNVRARHRSEDRGNLKEDSLISRDEDRWSGRLVNITRNPDGAVFSFKSDFQASLLELSERDVSTIFFRQQENAAAPDSAPPFALRLSGEGSLRVTSCTFSQDSITARHPLLGPLKIKRSGVVAMERLQTEPEGKSSE
ncbi:MAG: hypothetical protein ACRCXD_00210 [Luteolibacter sp.]